MTLAARQCTCDLDGFPGTPCPVHGELGRERWEQLERAAGERETDWPPPHAKLLGSGKVWGVAATAGSKSAGVVTVKDPATGRRVPKMRDGRVQTFVKDSSGEKGKTWRSDVRDAVREVVELAEGSVYDCPLALELVVYRSRNKGHFGSGRNAGVLKDSAPAYPATKPDSTKQLRAFEDALSRVIWRDDSRIVRTFVGKAYGEVDHVAWGLYALPETVGDLRYGDNPVIFPTQVASPGTGGEHESRTVADVAEDDPSGGAPSAPAGEADRDAASVPRPRPSLFPNVE